MALQSIGERHFPPISKIKPDQLSCFSQKFISHESFPIKPIVFQMCAYVPGKLPQFALPRETANEVPISQHTVQDPNTKEPMEVMHTYEVVALGSVLLAESPSGAGGFGFLAKYLNAMAREHVDKDYPYMQLPDLCTRDFMKTVRDGGGVKEITFHIVKGIASEMPFLKKLTSLFVAVPNAKSMNTKWVSSSEGELDEATVFDLFREAEQWESDCTATIFLKNGQSISNNGNLSFKKSVEVDGKAGVPDQSSLRKKMLEYLLELQTPTSSDSGEVIGKDGALRPNYFSLRD